MDGYRLPCGKCRCATHILHLCQLGLPDWCLSVQILWPPVPGRPYLVALSLHGFCRDPCRATPSLSLCMNGLGVNVSSKSIRLEVGLSLAAGQPHSAVCDACAASGPAGNLPGGGCAARHVQLVAASAMPVHRSAFFCLPDSGVRGNLWKKQQAELRLQATIAAQAYAMHMISQLLLMQRAGEPCSRMPSTFH